jgi:hypothetical protein
MAAEGTLDLGFGLQAYLSLGSAGLAGIIPAACWAVALGDLGRRANAPLLEGLTLLMTPLVLVGPVALPCLLLRIRRPEPARVAWGEAGVEEQQGDFVCARIPWERATAIRCEWSVGTRSHTPAEAIQITDRATGDTITLWTSVPERLTGVRRAMTASTLEPLIAVLEARGVPIEQKDIDWQEVNTAARPRGWLVWMSRLVGYPAVALACASAGASLPSVLLIVGVIALLLRLRPALSEWKALRRRGAAIAHAPQGPYRVAPQGPEEADRARSERDAALRRAVGWELCVRAAIPVLVVIVCVAHALVR